MYNNGKTVLRKNCLDDLALCFYWLKVYHFNKMEMRMEILLLFSKMSLNLEIWVISSVSFNSNTFLVIFQPN